MTTNKFIHIDDKCIFIDKILYFRSHNLDGSKSVIQLVGDDGSYIIVDATVDELVDALTQESRHINT